MGNGKAQEEALSTIKKLKKQKATHGETKRRGEKREKKRVGQNTVSFVMSDRGLIGTLLKTDFSQ